MSLFEWKQTVDAKVASSWNLHCELPRGSGGLEFFVLLSSAMGIVGGGGLAAYNAGNAFQDALARYRRAQGECAMALDLGPVEEAGFLAENGRQASVMRMQSAFVSIRPAELMALLDLVCDKGSEESGIGAGTGTAQTIVGIVPPSDRHTGHEGIALLQPHFGHIRHLPQAQARYSTSSAGESENWQDMSSAFEQQPDAPAGSSSEMACDQTTKRRDDTRRAADRLAAASSLTEATAIACEAIALRLAALLGVTEERRLWTRNAQHPAEKEIDAPMSSYGVDSLTAIDIRAWVGRLFGVDLAMAEILGEGGMTVGEAGAAVASRFWKEKEKAMGSKTVAPGEKE